MSHKHLLVRKLDSVPTHRFMCRRSLPASCSVHRCKMLTCAPVGAIVPDGFPFPRDLGAFFAELRRTQLCGRLLRAAPATKRPSCRYVRGCSGAQLWSAWFWSCGRRLRARRRRRPCRGSSLLARFPEREVLKTQKHGASGFADTCRTLYIIHCFECQGHQ